MKFFIQRLLGLSPFEDRLKQICVFWEIVECRDYFFLCRFSQQYQRIGTILNPSGNFLHTFFGSLKC